VQEQKSTCALPGSVADPDSGSGAFLISGSGIWDPEWVKIHDPDPRSGMEKIRFQDPGWKKVGTGIRNPEKHPGPQHCYLDFWNSAKNILVTGEGVPAGARPLFRRHRNTAGPEGGALQPGTPGVPRRHALHTLSHLQETGLWRLSWIEVLIQIVSRYVSGFGFS
jgi:hypothetical protein